MKMHISRTKTNLAKRSYHEKQIEKLQATWKVSNRNKGKRGLPSNSKEIANLSGK